jgi:succinate dehydrogenase / fumarate reductase cytochrome b subunit
MGLPFGFSCSDIPRLYQHGASGGHVVYELRPMTTRALTMRDTTIGKKLVMAASGIVLFGFVIGHMLGNLQVYLGPTPFNEYSKFIHDTPTLMWGTRVVLLLAVLAHIVTALQLWKLNAEARPVAYAKKKDVATSYAARTMRWSGPIILAYIVYHLAHLTFGVTNGLGYEHLPLDANGIPDVYHNVVLSFKVPWCFATYCIAQVMLALHLYHGAWSLFQSLGINHRRYNETLRSVASAIALATTAGFLAVPVGVFFDLVP